MGFFMRGELFGLDGIAAARYDNAASALEDGEIVVLPLALRLCSTDDARGNGQLPRTELAGRACAALKREGSTYTCQARNHREREHEQDKRGKTPPVPSLRQ